jgi:hypothetical protein
VMSSQVPKKFHLRIWHLRHATRNMLADCLAGANDQLSRLSRLIRYSLSSYVPYWQPGLHLARSGALDPGQAVA